MPAPDASSSLDEQLDALIAAHGDSVHIAVAVRDPSTGFSLDRKSNRPFHAASTMKVPVMIEVFRQAETGRFDLDDSIPVKTTFTSIADSSAYDLSAEDDSDQDLYTRVGESLSIRELTHRMINVSSNLATNLLIDLVDADSVQRTIRSLGTTTMEVLRGVEDIPAYRQGLNNTATAADLATLFAALARGEAVSPEADQAMIDILLEQKFNEMIPAGLPENVRVAHKTGWITAIHHDAALVLPPDAEPFVLVVLTEGFQDESTSANVAADIARLVYQTLRES